MCGDDKHSNGKAFNKTKDHSALALRLAIHVVYVI